MLPSKAALRDEIYVLAFITLWVLFVCNVPNKTNKKVIRLSQLLPESK